ncbi:hypothetical protein [Haloterrigena salifodinae]|uniref:hypothetical protein n=1 Tax=Haloterrigena salifodinae TaxID=2675099 RepID=UPI000F888BF6|nr:hypothetical protein [Haloterrigena salifodinae]
MKRTRRAALLLMAASSGTLAVETLGLSRSAARRDAAVDAAGDAVAYLGLTEDGVEAGGTLFEDGPRPSPATFSVVNGLSAPIALTLASNQFRIRTTDEAAAVDGDRLLVGGDAGDPLDPGDRLAEITVEPTPAAIGSLVGSTITGTVDVTATGAETRVDAERDLSLSVPGVSVERALLSVSQRGGGVFEHRWLLEGVDTTTHGLEALKLDYRNVETAGAIDFTDADGPSVSVTADGADRLATIETLEPNRLTVALADALILDGAAVELVLAEPGGPASPGGQPGSPTGATVELFDAGFSATAEATRDRP